MAKPPQRVLRAALLIWGLVVLYALMTVANGSAAFDLHHKFRQKDLEAQHDIDGLLLSVEHATDEQSPERAHESESPASAPPVGRQQEGAAHPPAKQTGNGQTKSSAALDATGGGKNKLETAFTRHIRSLEFPKRLASLCGGCRVARENQPEGVSADGSWKPDFCNQLPSNPTYSFSADVATFDSRATAPDGATLVLSVLGTRYYGPGGQEYVWEAVRQWRVFHPSTNPGNKLFVLVTDTQARDRYVVANATAFDAQLVRRSDVESHVPEWKRFDRVFYSQGVMHPGGSKKTGNLDFNRLISARFFAILGLMRRDALANVVHMENDIMVYTDYGPVVQAWRRCGSGMATLFPAKKGAIPGVFLIKDATALSGLTGYIADLLSCGGESFGRQVQKGYANDMTYILNYYELHGAAAIADLPNQFHKPGENCLADELPGLLFDGASFGQWYSFAFADHGPGSDAKSLSTAKAVGHFNAVYGDAPRAAHTTTTATIDDDAMSKFVKASVQDTAVTVAQPKKHIRNAMKERYLDATPGTLLRWVLDDEGRRVPQFGKHRLAMLHIHAKNLFWFRST